jgi:hypothetical protein
MSVSDAIEMVNIGGDSGDGVGDYRSDSEDDVTSAPVRRNSAEASSSSASSSAEMLAAVVERIKTTETVPSNFTWSLLNDRYCFADDASILAIVDTPFITPDLTNSLFVDTIIDNARSYFKDKDKLAALIRYHTLWLYMVVQWNNIVLKYANIASSPLDDDNENIPVSRDVTGTRPEFSITHEEADIIEEILIFVCVAISTPRCVIKLRETDDTPEHEISLSSIGRDANDIGEATFMAHLIKNLGYGFAFAYRRETKTLVIPTYLQVKHIDQIDKRDSIRAQGELAYSKTKMDVYFEEYLEAAAKSRNGDNAFMDGRMKVVNISEETNDEYSKAKEILSSTMRARKASYARNNGHETIRCDFPSCAIS